MTMEDKTYRDGLIEGQKESAAQASIQAIRRCLNSLMITQKMDLEEALAALQIPKNDRKIYRKIFTEQQRGKTLRGTLPKKSQTVMEKKP